MKENYSFAPDCGVHVSKAYIRGAGTWMPLRVLIDTGATSSLLSTTIAGRIGAHADGSGGRIQSPLSAAGVQHSFGTASVNLSLDAHEVPVNALLVELSGADLILGMDMLSHAQIDLLCGILAMPGGDGVHRFIRLARHQRHGVGGVLAPTTAPEKPDGPASVCAGDDDDVQEPQEPHEVDSNRVRAAKGTSDAQASGSLGDYDDTEQARAQLLRDFEDIFDEQGPQKFFPPRTRFQHRILPKPSAEPFAARPKRLAEREVQEFKRQLSEWRTAGWVERSNSPWRATPVFVRKKSGETRICFNYGPLNDRTEPDAYPLNDLRTMLNLLSRKTWLTTLDAQKGFHQVAMEPASKHYTAFWSPFGLFQFRVMPFGLKNAPATFQRTLDEILGEAKGEYADVLMDDIIVFSDSYEMHLAHVRDILERLRQSQLFLSPSKCSLVRRSTTFLGYELSPNGVQPTRDKIQAIQEWPRPQNKRQLQSFLGAVNFLRDFIRDYQRYIDVFADLLSSDQFQWTPRHQQAFAQLKEGISRAPSLILPDPRATFYVATDASESSIGAVLLQEYDGKLCPLGFSSRRLQKRERRGDSSTHELCGVIHALRRWRPLLQDAHVVLFTDHKPLLKLNDDEIGGQLRFSKWVDTFLYEKANMNLRLEHRPGKSGIMQLVDTLSRPPHIGSTPIPQGEQHPPKQPEAANQAGGIFAGALEASTGSRFFSPRAYMQDSRFQDHSWLEKNGVCYDSESGYFYASVGTDRETVVVVPRVEEVILDILYETHAAPGAGHPGIWATFQRLRSHFWWPGIEDDVKRYVKSCDTCQRVKIPRMRAGGPAQPLPAPSSKGEVWHADFFVGLPPSGKWRHDAVLVLVERFSRFVHLVPVPSNISTDQLLEIFQRRIVSVYGVPSILVTDRGSLFTSRLFRRALCSLGIDHRVATTGHPQTNGVAENAVNLAKTVLKTLRDRQRWSRHLAEAEFALNTRPSRTTKLSPYYVMFGQTPPLSLRTTSAGDGKRPLPLGRHLRFFRHILERAEAEQLRAQQRTAEQLNRRRGQRYFREGDEVLLDVRGWSLAGQHSEGTLRHPFVGPLRVLERVAGNAYRLDLPSRWRIHPVVNVERLQRYIRGDGEEAPLQGEEAQNEGAQPGPVFSPEETRHGEPEYEVERLVSHRVNRRSKQREFLVHWSGWGPEERQWLPEADVKHLEAYKKYLQEHLGES